METATGRLLDDRIEWVKNSGASWAPDSEGFYYSAYDAPDKNVYSAQNRYQKIRYHRIGDPQSADRLVYEDKAHPLRYFHAWEKGGWLFVIASEGTSGNEVLYRRADDTTAPLRVLLPGFSSDYNLFECKDDKLYYATNRDAANFVVRRLDLNDPDRKSVV